ncbi:hypothetical protein [Glutamicibacter halophytocola]|uniref:hypothetical protein n=1 Tax=Glutamicibacter halophytocola TaxID=1933880 RepID=UPI0015C56B33|nr:hypothetical protein [Glutamicibacter halophytocola]NQD40513.1 hypothetical protein [Glutamicibacter halophytocola]
MKEFYDAVAELLPVDVKVSFFNAKLSTPPAPSDYPYAVIGGDGGWDFSGDGPEEPSLTAELDGKEFRVMITLAGTSISSLDFVLKRVRPALSGKKPVVAGWSCSTMEQAPLVGIRPDRDISVDGLNPLFMVDEYVFTATRN